MPSPAPTTSLLRELLFGVARCVNCRQQLGLAAVRAYGWSSVVLVSCVAIPPLPFLSKCCHNSSFFPCCMCVTCCCCWHNPHSVPTQAPVWSVTWSSRHEQQLLLGLDKGRVAMVDLRMTGPRALVYMSAGGLPPYQPWHTVISLPPDCRQSVEQQGGVQGEEQSGAAAGAAREAEQQQGVLPEALLACPGEVDRRRGGRWQVVEGQSERSSIWVEEPARAFTDNLNVQPFPVSQQLQLCISACAACLCCCVLHMVSWCILLELSSA